MCISMRMAHTQTNIALFGAGGYTGAELAKLLAVHPSVRLVCAASDTHAGKSVDDFTGASTGLKFVTTEQALATKADFALLAIPPEPATRLTPQLRAAGTKVIDLSNAY